MMTSEGITIMRRELPVSTLVMRRADLMMRASPETITSMSMDMTRFFKVITPVESVMEVEKIGNICVCLVKG